MRCNEPVAHNNRSLLMSLIFLLSVSLGLCACSTADEQAQRSVELSRVTTIGEADGVMFGDLHRMTAANSGVLYVADGAASQLLALEPDGNVGLRSGQRGPGPGEFETGPGALTWYADSLFVVEASSRTIHVFDDELRFARRVPVAVPGFTPREIVSADGSLFSGGLGASAETRLVKLTDNLHGYESIPLIHSHHDLAWDTFLLEATSDALIVAYIFRNVIEVHPIDGREATAFAVELPGALPEPPPVDKATPLARDNMPEVPYIWSITVDSSDRIYLLAYDFTANPERDVLVYDLDGTHLTTFTLPEPAQRIYIDQQDRLYAATKGRTELSMYDMDFTSVD